MSNSRLKSEHGAAFVFFAITVMALLGFVFVAIQTAKSRVDGMRLLYTTFQASQAGYANYLRGQYSFDSAFWAAYLNGGAVAKPTYVSSNQEVSVAIDSDGDGSNDGTFHLNYIKANDTPAQFRARISSTSTFLSGFLGLLEDTTIATRARSFSGETFVNLSVDLSNLWRRINNWTKLADLYGVDLTDVDGAGAPTHRNKLPGYLNGQMLYEHTGGGATRQNCANSDLTSTNMAAYTAEYSGYFGRVSLNNYNAPGFPGGRNGFCANPWSRVDPLATMPNDNCCDQTPAGVGCGPGHLLYGASCPTQQMQLVNRATWMMNYKKRIDALVQALSVQERLFRFSIFGGIPPAGPIAQLQSNGQEFKGDFTLFNSRNAMREPVDPAALGLVSRSGPGDGTAGCATWSIDNPANIQLGMDREHEWAGRLSSLQAPGLAVNNSINSAAGHNYLKPLDYVYDPSAFTHLRIGPTGFVNDVNHPAFVGFKPLGNTSGGSDPYYTPGGTATDPTATLPDQAWFTPYAIRANGAVNCSISGGVESCVLFNNPSVSHYATQLFAAAHPIGGGRDVRAVFQNALAECQARKATYGSGTSCYNVVILGGYTDGGGILNLEGSQDSDGVTYSRKKIPCTTKQPIDYATHLSQMTAALTAFEALENTATIVAYLAPTAVSLTDPAITAITNLFVNGPGKEKRFLINLETTLNLDGISGRMGDLVDALSVLTRDRPQTENS